MNLRKKHKPGACAANRCTAEPYVRMADGVELCVKHAGQYMPTCEGSQAPPTGEPPNPGVLEGAAPAPAQGSTELAPAHVRAEVVQPIEIAAIDFCSKVTAMPLQITSQAQADAVGQIAAYAQRKISEIEAERKSATGHLVKAKRQIDGWFKPAVESYKAAKTACHTAISAYIAEQNAAKAAELAAGNHDAAMAVASPVLPAGTHERKRWTFRVTDPSLVPREFLAIDAARVQAVVTAQREHTSIPGIEAYEDTTIVTRGL